MVRDITFAMNAIKRLNTFYRTGRPNFDAWIDYAIRDWQKFIVEEMQK
jgi:hypothetical protein